MIRDGVDMGKVHLEGARSSQAACGASGNMLREVSKHQGVTCERCLKILWRRENPKLAKPAKKRGA